jgi:hypothetical protein
LPDAIFRAVLNRSVVLQLTDGQELAVRILDVRPEELIISLSSSGQVRTLPRAYVTTARLPSATPVIALAPDCPEPRLPAAPLRKRYLAVNLSLVPGFDLDLDAGLFHGFSNLGILMLAATNSEIVPLSFGVGISIPVARNLPALMLDVFAHLNIISDVNGDYPQDTGLGMGNWVGFGAGLGLHYTWINGLTMGFTVPILGYSVQFGQIPWPVSINIGTGVINYFLTSAEALPLFYIGYRF